MMLGILVKEREASRRLFRLFEFILVKTSFINVLKPEELAQVARDCDGLFKIMEGHSFVEIFDKIEKRICESKNELSFAAEDLSVILFIFSSHSFGSESFFLTLYDSFNKQQDNMSPEELITCLWSFATSGYFSSKLKSGVITKKLQDFVESNISNVDEYYQNLYYYALQLQL